MNFDFGIILITISNVTLSGWQICSQIVKARVKVLLKLFSSSGKQRSSTWEKAFTFSLKQAVLRSIRVLVWEIFNLLTLSNNHII